MSGLVTLDLSNNQNMQIIDIDFDYDDSKKQNTTPNTPMPISKSNGSIQQNKTDTLFGNNFVFFYLSLKFDFYRIPKVPIKSILIRNPFISFMNLYGRIMALALL
jgi:hypothetical protein